MVEVPFEIRGSAVPEQQPLNNKHLTEGSVWVLPGYPALFVIVGIIFIFQGASRTSGPAYEPAKAIMSFSADPMNWWGYVFIAVGIIEIYAFLSEVRKILTWTLVIGTGLTVFWGILLTKAAIDNDQTSFTSGMFLYFVAHAHIASIRSLVRDWVIK